MRLRDGQDPGRRTSAVRPRRDEVPSGCWVRARLGGTATAVFGSSGTVEPEFLGQGQSGNGHYVIGQVSNWASEDYSTFWWRVGPVPGVVDKWTLALNWTIEWSTSQNGEWKPAGGQHTYHSLFTGVHDPLQMGNQPPDNRSFPWRVVLERATQFASGKDLGGEAIAALMDRIYHGPLVNYPDEDWEWGQVGYGDTLAHYYLFAAYLANSADMTTTVFGQCTDVAGLLVVLGRSLGIPFQNFVIDTPDGPTGDHFVTKEIDPIGDPGSQITDWNYHEVAANGGQDHLYDACLQVQPGGTPFCPEDLPFGGDYRNYVRESGDWNNTDIYVPRLINQNEVP